MVGADVAMMTSAVLRHGPTHLARRRGRAAGLDGPHDYDSVDQLRGSASQATSDDPSAFERANYMRTLHSWAAPSAAHPTAPGVDPATSR